jgi:hypothetical protein
MLERLLAALIGTAALSCGSRPPEPAAVAISLSAEPAARPSGTWARRAASASLSGKDLLTIALPERVACRVASTSLRFGRVDVAMAPGAPPFATLTSTTSMTAHLPEGGFTAFPVEADLTGLFVRAVASAEDVAFHTTRVSVFGGVVMPKGHTRLRAVGATSDGVRLRIDLPAEVRVGDEESVASGLPCSILSLDTGDFDPFETYFGAPVDGGLLRGATIAISSTSEGAPTATLTPGPKTPRQVSILARDKKRVKITWELDDIIAFGWVDARDLSPLGRVPESFGMGGLGLSGVGPGCCERALRCPGEVPVGVTQGGLEEVVAIASPGAAIRVLEEQRERLVVSLDDVRIDLAEGATMFVTKDAVADCDDPDAPRGKKK